MNIPIDWIFLRENRYQLSWNADIQFIRRCGVEIHIFRPYFLIHTFFRPFFFLLFWIRSLGYSFLSTSSPFLYTTFFFFFLSLHSTFSFIALLDFLSHKLRRHWKFFRLVSPATISFFFFWLGSSPSKMSKVLDSTETSEFELKLIFCAHFWTYTRLKAWNILDMG